MKKNIAIIILSFLLFISILITILTVLIKQNNQNKFIKQNDVIIKELIVDLVKRENQIEQYKIKKYYTEKELENKSDSEKTKIILKLQDSNKKQSEIIENDTVIIKDLNFRLDQTNEKLKNRFYPKHGFSAFILAGLDKGLEIDLYIGVNYRRYFLEGRFYIGGGIAFKPYENLGGAGLFELGFTF